MAKSSTLVTYFVGLLLLVHSGYSSYEFHKLSAITHQSSHLPIDILVETLVGIIVIVIGGFNSIENSSVLTFDGREIQPDYKYLKPIEMKDSVKLIERIGTSDYEELESRLPFIDIVGKRKKYDEWVKSHQD
ncbi:magnesium transporter [Scheffersomyces amazonensis]|uniref:magnesium transporter n=1 Tax=Scheffersomyces amazonensis TaxID=1078765 RepID=UPI00315DABD7